MNKKQKDGFLKQAFVTRTEGYLNVFPKQELWKQIGKELNGEFRVSHNSGNELEILKLYIPYGKYLIKLSESDTRPLKFEIEFDSQLDYELTLGFEDTIEKLLKRLGKKEIEIGDKKFDNHYLIKSKDKAKTLRLFTRGIIDCLLQYNVYSLSYTTDHTKRKSRLISVISRTVDDKKTIIDLIEMHKQIIDKLVEMHLIK